MAKKQLIIKVKWSYPREFENAKETELSYEGFGVYCISRKFGGKESIIYIGKTTRQFRDRLRDHSSKWLNNYRGEKIVRFGTITQPRTVTVEIINDVESAIIYEIEPIHNTDKINKYTFSETYKIINEGFKGQLPKEMDINNHT
jgi:predicted GIY-YIG superfamily endonuclease